MLISATSSSALRRPRSSEAETKPGAGTSIAWAPAACSFFSNIAGPIIGLIEGADPTIAALTGRIDVRVADTTLIDLAADGTPVDLEFAYTLSAQAKLVLTAHEIYLPKPKLAVEGPGGVQASFDFRGAKNDVAGRMLTVTLTNDLDGTEYA